MGNWLVLSSFTTDNLVCLSWAVLLLAISGALSTTVAYMTTEFALTDRRVIAKAGLIRRRSVDLLLAKVESIGVRQSIGGRILDFGTVTVTGTGGTKEPFGNIAQPMELRRRVQAQIATGP
jgi:uncharacterized membrane protein YdbT with pleckstrin-like domain